GDAVGDVGRTGLAYPRHRHSRVVRAGYVAEDIGGVAGCPVALDAGAQPAAGRRQAGLVGGVQRLVVAGEGRVGDARGCVHASAFRSMLSGPPLAGTARSATPVYSLNGRIRELAASCSTMCAVQPVIRDIT